MAKQEKLKEEIPEIADSDNDDNNNDQRIGSDLDGMKCQVCGISAEIRYFGGITCRPCGAFFRRCVALNKEYNCQCALKKFINDIVDEQFCCRVFCRACRLKKCLEVGMRPEVVRSAYLRRFHTERQAKNEAKLQSSHENRRGTRNLAISLISNGSNGDEQQCEGKINTMVPNISILTHSEPAHLDSFYMRLLLSLLPLEPRTHRIYSSETILSHEYYHKFKTLEDLTECKENILGQYYKFSEKRPAVWPRLMAIKYREQIGFWEDSHFLGPYFQNLMLCVDLVKTIPVFSKLELEDRKAMLQDAVGKVFQFSMSYFSSAMCNETIVWSDEANMFELFSAVARHYKSNLMINAARKVFVNPMAEMNRIRPSKEEFVLLLAMLVSNPASSGLSEYGKLILYAEAEKYGKVLMQFEQNRLGQSAGVLRCMELQSLIWSAISSTYKAREMNAYFDTVLDQGCYKRIFFPVFCQLTLDA